MKRYLFPLASALTFLVFGLREINFLTFPLIVIALLISTAAAKTIFDFCLSGYRGAQKIFDQTSGVIRVLHRISQLEPAQMNQFLALTNSVSNTNMSYPITPQLGLVDFHEDEKTVSPIKEVSYNPQHAFSDLQKIEEESLKLPELDRKLVVFASKNSQSKETEIIESLKKSEAPEFAIQFEIFSNTDVIEISQSCFSKNKDLFFRLEHLFGSKYQHYLFISAEKTAPMRSKASLSSSLHFKEQGQ